MLHLGGYHGLENDERLWQEIAIQLELPAWPTPEVPDPIRILQQVYRDYLLRFETRFALQRAPAGAGAGLAAVGANPLLQQAGLAGVLGAGNGSGGGSGGVQGPVGRRDHSPALSTATTQYNAAAGAGAIMAGLASALGGNIAGSNEAAAAVAAAAATNGTGLSRAQQLMQLPVLQPAISGMGDIFLDRSLSGDILDALTDLIPMPCDQGAAAAAAARDNAANGSGSSGSGSGNGSSAPERPGSFTLLQAMAAQELAARHAQAGPGAAPASGPPVSMGPGSGPGPAAGGTGGPGGAGPSRQQGQITEARRRKQQQQLLQQLQLMASEVTAGAFAGGSGSSRLKRPPPLIRCGDSDLVNLMDQVDVERILREHEQQRQQQQQQVLAGVQQGAGAAQQQGAQRQGLNSVAAVAAAGGGPANAALAEALDADMQDMLEGYLQQHDKAQQERAQAQPTSQQQQQQRQEGGAGAPRVKQTEDAVSGMLEALQIEQQQQQQQAAGAVPGLPQHPLQHQLTQEFLPHQYKLHMQQSVGAHLMSDLLQQTGVAGSTGAPSPGNSSGPCPAPLPAATAAAAAQQQAQRQQQVDDAALQAFAGGLLRLSTPNSAILGSVLDSPAHKAGAAQWMDLPTTSLEGAQQAQQQQGQQLVQQQQQQERPPLRGQSDDVGALMHLW